MMRVYKENETELQRMQYDYLTSFRWETSRKALSFLCSNNTFENIWTCKENILLQKTTHYDDTTA